MKVVVFHGSPRKGNTEIVTDIFKKGMSERGEVEFTDFYFPKDLPEFCVGCQICLGNPYEKCPHVKYTQRVYEAIMEADALVFCTPHYGASCMPAGMKNLLDHMDFMNMTVAPRKENFSKKAFVLTTGSGSAASIRIIRKDMIHWGINRVRSLGIRMLTDKWENIPDKRRKRLEKRIRKSAGRFYDQKRRFPCPGSLGRYYINRFVIRKYMKPGDYPYDYWKEHGYFERCPLFGNRG